MSLRAQHTGFALREIGARGYNGGISLLKAWLAPLKFVEPEPWCASRRHRASRCRWTSPPCPAATSGTVFAQVVEVRVSGKEVKVLRVVSVADPGRVLDLCISAAGIEGGVAPIDPVIKKA